jgi:hypothetical protein
VSSRRRVGLRRRDRTPRLGVGSLGSRASRGIWRSMTSLAKGSKGGASRSISRSPRKSGEDNLAAGLSARMGDLLLTEKETSGLVIRSVDSGFVPRPRWAIVGKVCSPLGALE